MERKPGKVLDGRGICLALHLRTVSATGCPGEGREGRLETSWKAVPLGPRSCSSLLPAVPLPFSLPQASGWDRRPGAPVGGGSRGRKEGRVTLQGLIQASDVLVMPGPSKNTSASRPLSTSIWRQGSDQRPSRMASRIPALPVFSKGTETSHLPPNFPFLLSSHPPREPPGIWLGSINWKLAIFRLNCTVTYNIII